MRSRCFLRVLCEPCLTFFDPAVQLEIDANALGEANTQLQELIESLQDEVRSLRSVVDMHRQAQCCAGSRLETQYGQEEQ